MAGVLETLRVNAKRMQANMNSGILATDLADYLVSKGVPFREAHDIVGHAVRMAEDQNTDLSHLSMEAYQTISSIFEKDVYQVFSFASAVEKKNGIGGTASEAVSLQINKAKQLI